MKNMTLDPVPNLDAEQQFDLLAIRNQQLIRDSSYSTHIIDTEEHKRWIERLEKDPSISFYAVKLKGEIVGGVGLRNIDQANNMAEWSFYISEVAHGKGIGLALGVQALDLFFNTLHLKQVLGEALTSNSPSLAYHQKLGFSQTEVQQRRVQPGNLLTDIAVFSLSEPDWQVRRRQLCALG